jgi:hypothetical protein
MAFILLAVLSFCSSTLYQHSIPDTAFPKRFVEAAIPTFGLRAVVPLTQVGTLRGGEAGSSTKSS